jgi:mannose-6-phosphate isomerase-like protein (cupin superfamily)
VVIIPRQRHKVCQEGDGDLVMLVTCVPAYSGEEVAFDEQPDGPGGLSERGKPGRRD